MSNAPETTESDPAPVFRKTKQGKWAVMGPVTTLQAALDGDGKVQVLKKSGDWSSFTVVSLGRPFDVDGVSMCYGYDDAGDSGSTAGSNQGPAGDGHSADRPPTRRSSAPPPPVDNSEPLPEYRGGSEDEWTDGF